MQKGDIFPILKEHTCQKLSKRKTVSNSPNNPQVLITSPWSSEKTFWNTLSFSFVELKRRALIMRVLFRVCSVWKLKSAAKWFMPGGSMSIFQTFPKLSGIISVHTLDLLVVARIPAATCRSRIISSPTKNWKKKKKRKGKYIQYYPHYILKPCGDILDMMLLSAVGILITVGVLTMLFIYSTLLLKNPIWSHYCSETFAPETD